MAHGILVALDGSPFAARSLPYAELLAQETGAELILAQVVHAAPQLEESGAEPVFGHVGQPEEHTQEPEADARRRAFDEATENLAELRTLVAAEGPRVKTIVEAGDPAHVLLDLARADDVALIVMATHGRSGLSRWVMGSVAEQVLRRTHLPVLLLTSETLDAGGPERLKRRLVVPVDGSDVSQSIFPIAQAVARRLHLPVTLVEVLEPTPLFSIGAIDTPGVPAPLEAYQAAQEAVQARVADLAEEWRGAGLDADSTVEGGAPVDGIVSVATKRQAGWIAMASHGRGGLGGLVLGSTALAVLRRATLPLLVAATPHPDRYQLGEAD